MSSVTLGPSSIPVAQHIYTHNEHWLHFVYREIFTGKLDSNVHKDVRNKIAYLYYIYP